ncbi:MAG: DUF5610 domain-containing protein [bacterium]
MLSEINALSNQISSATETGAQVRNKETTTDNNYSQQQQLKFSQEQQDENGYAGVKLDLSNSVEMGVHEKTARMVIETNVRMSIESSFQGVEPSESSGEEGKNVGLGSNAEETARNLIDFAKKFLDGFMDDSQETKGEDGEKTLADFIEKIKGAADEGFESAREELAGENDELQNEIAEIFEEVKNYFEEYLEIFGSLEAGEEAGETVKEAGEDKEAAETSGKVEEANEQAAAEIASENQRAADNAVIPPGLQERLGR